MRILFITNDIPHYTGGGTPIRDYNLLRHLTGSPNGYEITLLCFRDAGDESAVEKITDLETFCERVVTVPRPQRPASRWLNKLNVLERLAHPVPWHVRDLAPRVLMHKVRYLARQKPYAVVHANHVEMAPVLAVAARAKKVVGQEMVSPKLLGLLKTQSGAITRLAARIEIEKFRRYEPNVYRRADLCTLVSDVERCKVLELVPDANVCVIENGVDTGYFRCHSPVELHRHTPRILFVGTMAYPPNHEAVLHFYTQVWSLLKLAIPGVRWQIVGKDPAPSIRNLSSDDIEVTGWVQDIRPFMWQSQVMIVPLLSGSGTRLKILEAMAAGTPVVSTLIGAEGLNVTHGRDILLADEPAKFADAVIRVLRDPELARSLSENGRRLVESQYDWSMIAHKLDDAYQSLFR